MSKTIKIKHNKNKIVNKRKNTYKVKSKSGKKSKQFTRKVGGYGNKEGQKSKSYKKKQRKLNKRNNPKKEKDIPSNEAEMRDPKNLKAPLFTPEKEGEKDNIHSEGPNEPVIPLRQTVPQNIPRKTEFADHPLDEDAEEENNTARATLGDPNDRDNTPLQTHYDADVDRFEPIGKKSKLNTPNNRNTRATVNASGLFRQPVGETENPLLPDTPDTPDTEPRLNAKPMIETTSKTQVLSSPVPVSEPMNDPGSIDLEHELGNVSLGQNTNQSLDLKNAVGQEPINMDSAATIPLPEVPTSRITIPINKDATIHLPEVPTSRITIPINRDATIPMDSTGSIDFENELGNVPRDVGKNNQPSLNTLYPQYNIDQPSQGLYPEVPDIKSEPVDDGSVLTTARSTAQGTPRSTIKFTSANNNFNEDESPIRFTSANNNLNGDDTPIRATQLPIDKDIDRNTSLDSVNDSPINIPAKMNTNELDRSDVAAGINSNPPNNSNLTEETAQPNPNQCDMSSTLNTLLDKGTGIYLNILNKMAEDETDEDKKQKINELMEKLKRGSSEMNDTLKSFITELKSIYPECDYETNPSNTKIENILKVDAGSAIGSALMAIMLLGGKKKKTRGKKHRVSKKKSRRSTKK